MALRDFYNVRPASEDPLGDPADQEQNILPASQDPLGDPADQRPAGMDIRPASEDPYGDPALEEFQGRWGQPDFNEQEAAGFYDRFARQPYCQGPQCEYLAQIPPQDFQQSAQQAAQQMPPQEREEVAGGLLGALRNHGIDLGQLAGMIGLGSTTPQQMGPDDLSRLLGWTQQNQPNALGEAVADKPWFVKHLGNPVVHGILANLAKRFLR